MFMVIDATFDSNSNSNSDFLCFDFQKWVSKFLWAHLTLFNMKIGFPQILGVKSGRNHLGPSPSKNR